MKKAPKQMTSCTLDVLVMPNGEILCKGTTVGRVKDIGEHLIEKRPICADRSCENQEHKHSWMR